MRKILITGSTGMLGTSVVREFLKKSEYEVFGLSRKKTELLPFDRQLIVDLANPDEIGRLDVAVDAIVHTAAITDLQFCQSHPDVAHAVHVKAPAALQRLLKPGGRFFYISTDSVFDGESGNYREHDQPNPLNEYALTKLEGERAALKMNAESVTIIRTNIYGFHVPFGNSLAEWAYQSWIARKKISGFKDVSFNAVYTVQLATIIEFLLANNIMESILNIGSKTSVSKFEFLDKIRQAMNVAPELLSAALSTNFPSAFKRPKNTTLNTTLLSSYIEPPEFDKGIQMWLQDLRAASGPASE